MRFLSRFSIKVRVTAGFVTMQLILAAVAVSALLSISQTKTQVVEIAEDIQPAVLTAAELETSLEKANSHLGFYLLSKEEMHKDHYLESLAKVDSKIVRLRELNVIKNNPSSREQVSAIAADTEKFKSYQARMFELAQDPLKNIPARDLSARIVSPIAQQLLQLISSMIQSEAEEEPTVSRRALLVALEQVRYSMANVMNGFRAYLAFRSDSAKDDIRNYLESAKGSLDKVREHASELTLDQEDSLQQFDVVLEKFNHELEGVIKVHASEKWRMDSYLIKTEVGPLVNGISEKVVSLVAGLKNKITLTNNNLVSQTSKTTIVVGVLLVAGLIFGALIAYFIVQGIVRPLNQALKAMSDIAGGDGDLTQRLDDQGVDEVSQLASGFNSFASVVQNMVKEVSNYTMRLASEAERLTVVTDETSRGADRQQQETDQVATAVNEVSATVQEVARNADSAANAASDASNAANNGRQVVGETIESIDTLASEVEKAGVVIDRLEKDSESIGGVLDVIKGIAEQTNLLALNAAIEAARAGEQGRGFAVVADEVRTLASRTQQSTSEIQTMIERLQTGARDAVSVMEDGKNKAEASVGQAAKAGTSLEEINAAVTTITELNMQIASAAREQSTVVEEINQKVVNISEITDQTAAGAQQTSSASNELNKLADQLKSLVSQFKV